MLKVEAPQAMQILRTLLRLPLAIGRLLFAALRKSLKVALLAAAVGALLMLLDILLLHAGDDRPAS